MSDLENNPPPFKDENVENVDNLRNQMNLLFGCLLIASVTLTAYLGLQARRASLDLVSLQGPASESMRLDMQDNEGMQAVFGKLTEFGRTHPDFQKVVLSKYRFTTNGVPAAPAKK